MSWTPTSWHRFWFSLIAILIVMECVALFSHGPGDTLSEWTWAKIHSWPVRMLLGATLAWLMFHFLWWGPGRGLTWRDATAAVVGMLIGLASYAWAVR